MHTTGPAFQAAQSGYGTHATASPVVSTYWILRLGAALCFIGHGAFGFITKAAWLPYFGLVGIPETWAWRLMPLVGTVDVMVGMAVLFAPRALPLAYMTAWALWTALLRPLTGESPFETLERAGNYGVPLALLALTTSVMPWRSLLQPSLAPSDRDLLESRVARSTEILRWTTALLLFGHGGLGVSGKALLVSHYASLGLPADTTVIVGWLEIGLALVVAARPMAGLLLFVAAWKVATELLFITSGAPIWEFVERAGSYAAPLALVALLRVRPARASARS